MDLDRVAKALGQRLLLICVCALVGAALCLGGTFLAPKSYQAKARGLVSVSQPSTRSTNILTSGSLYVTARMSSYAAQGTSSVVFDAVRAKLGLDRSDTELRTQITSTTVVDTAFIEVTVQDPDAAMAQGIADETVRQTASLIERLEHNMVVVNLTDPGTAVRLPTARSYLVNPAAGFAGGLVIGVVIAVGLEYRRGNAGRAA